MARHGDDVQVWKQAADCAKHQGPASESMGEAGLPDHGSQQGLGRGVQR